MSVNVLYSQSPPLTRSSIKQL